MKKIRLIFPVFLIAVSSSVFGQIPDSVKNYLQESLDVLQKESLYAGRVDWQLIRDSVNQKIAVANTNKEAEAAIVWAFSQLKDHHGYYAGIDTFYRYTPPGPEREFSKGILEEYKKPRSPKIKMLDNGIAYYKMPAVLIGSDTDKMKHWANILSDSLCKIAALNPKGYIIDMRMNNGGNSEPMWQALKYLIGENNRTYSAGADLKILKDETDSAALQYRMAGTPDRSCKLNHRIPVAVLIGPGTASSGEIMTLSFTTRKNTRLFGERTAGVANATNGFLVQNKGFLLLSVAYMADAKKRVLTKQYIEPDVYIKSDDNYNEPEKDITVQAAVKWLKQRME